MTKTFCDRCGIEIIEHYAWLRHKEVYATFSLSGTRDKPFYATGKILCPQCEKGLIHWFFNIPKESETDDET